MAKEWREITHFKGKSNGLKNILLSIPTNIVHNINEFFILFKA